MSKRRKADETKQHIFEAASRILVSEGLTSLSLAAVAAEAGLSKGGLLYHFPNKVSLIEALFDYHNDIFEKRLLELTLREGAAPGAWLRAYAKASVEQMLDADTARIYGGLFAAEERYASAHALMREKYIRWQSEVDNSGIDQTQATLVRFAVDGLWLSLMHNYAPPDEAQRKAILNMILAMTHPHN